MSTDMDLRRTSTALTRVKKQSVVSIEDVKAQARITDGSEDTLIADYISAAFDFLSGPNGWLNGYCLLQETYEYHLDRIGEDGIELPLRPLSSLVVTQRNDAGVYSAVNTSLYYTASGDFAFPRLRRTPLQVWPGPTYNPHPLTFRMTVTAGHATGADVPDGIKLGIKMLAAHWYANRETTGPAGRTVGPEIEYGLKSLCGRYRLAHDHS